MWRRSMAINKLKTRDDFREYCLRKLGEPVIQVNVSPEQIEDAIDDALDMFWEYHADGSVQLFMKHQMTEEDLENRYFTLPRKVISVLRILSLGGGTIVTRNIYDNLPVYAYFSDLVSRIPKWGIGNYVFNMSYMQTVSEVFNAEKLFEYNKHQDRFYIVGDTTSLKSGDYVVLEIVTINDPDDHPETWNNWWLKNYTVATIKKQWGINLGKYQNVTLPSGITLNGEAIRSEANQEIATLEERLRIEFSLPLEPFMG